MLCGLTFFESVVRQHVMAGSKWQSKVPYLMAGRGWGGGGGRFEQERERPNIPLKGMAP
jgi:hypothetical protein